MTKKRRPKYSARADAARIKRLEAYRTKIDVARAAVGSCRNDVAKCVQRYAAALRAARKEQTRFARSLRGDDPAALFEELPSALSLTRELKGALADSDAALSETKAEVNKALKRITSRRRRIIIVT